MWRRLAVIGWLVWGCTGVEGAPPLTPRSPTIDTYHGVSVSDPFRWLEDWQNPQVKSWSSRQNTIARRVLDHLPQVDQLRQEVTDAYTARTTRYADLKIVA